MAKYVMGSYPSVKEAKSSVNELEREGYPVESISVVADQQMVTGLGDLGVAVEDDYYYDTADQGAWKRIKHFFGQKDRENTALYGHQQELRDGNILVVVDCDMVPGPLQTTAQETDDRYWDKAQDTAVNSPDEETIRLMSEHLNVNKEMVQTGEVTIKKRVVQETETIDVPVEHEELVIERKPLSGKAAATDSFDEETYTIPLSEEQVHVEKEPVVTEEIHLKKREVSGTKHVSDTVRKETLDIGKSGNVVMNDMDRGQNAGAP